MIGKRYLLALAGLAFASACSSKNAPEMPAETQGPEDVEIGALEPNEQTAEENTMMSAVRPSKAYELRKLPNGLEVYLVKKTEIPIVSILIAVRNGAFTESPDYNGLSHLYEHMFFKANQKVSSQQAFVAGLDEIGVEIGQHMNAFTSTESVRYFYTIQSRFAEKGIRFLADATISPLFLPDELERERKVVLDEFNRFEASPIQVFYQMELMKRLFQTNFSRKNTIGNRSVIETASPEQMREIQKRYYIPNNSALFVVGYFDESSIWPVIELSFGQWPTGPDPMQAYPIPEHPPLAQGENFIKEADVQTVNYVRAYHGPSLVIDNTGIIALDLVSQMLGFESSPFQKELVESGLVANASFSVWSQRYTSPLFFDFETSPEKAQAAMNKLNELISRVARGGFFTERDLETAKTSAEVRSAYDREVGQRYALGLASIWSSTGNLDFYTNYIELMKQVSLQDIDRELKEYLASKPYIAGALVPKGTQGLQLQ